MNRPCDCCEGPLALTPASTANRPGLSQLAYRVGTHGTFLETMRARLSSKDFPALKTLRTREGSDPSMAFLDAWATIGDVLTFYQERIANEGYLRTATERRSILELARLVGYGLRPGVSASVYLAYTLDKDSAPVEIPKGALANSVPAPGEQMQGFETAEPLLARVEWSAMKPRLTRPQLAYDIEQSAVIYLKGTATNLKPNDALYIIAGSSHQPRWVKTVEPDSANDHTRIELWNGPVKRDPRVDSLIETVVGRFEKIEDFNVSPDRAMTKRVLALLYGFWDAAQGGASAFSAHLMSVALPQLAREEQEATDLNYTKLLPWIVGLSSALVELDAVLESDAAAGIFTKSAIDALGAPPSIPPASAKQLPRSVESTLAPGSDTIPRLLGALEPALSGSLDGFLKNAPPSKMPSLEVHALRIVAAPFGHNAPPRVSFQQPKQLIKAAPATQALVPVTGEWEIDDPLNEGEASDRDQQKPFVLYLDNDYDLAPDGLILIDRPDRKDSSGKVVVPGEQFLAVVAKPLVHRSLTAYSLSGKTVQINLDVQKGQPWFPEAAHDIPPPDFTYVRSTRIYAGSEMLELAEVPITYDIGETEIELAGVYGGLEAGRWLIVAGERTDITTNGEIVRGVQGAELVMIAAVKQERKKEPVGIFRKVRWVPLPGEKLHTFISLANEGLKYRYKRDTVTIYGNVVKANHGETRREVLGSGDAAKAFQTFTLKQSPLTFVSAPTVSGVDSTLEVRVNDVQWHEAELLAALGPKDRKFLTRTDDDSKTSVVFGNGEFGLRLPTGIENIKATYRSGIGKPGNVKQGQISLLGTRPLGVKEVTNPIRASGGADRESRNQARKNAPLALMALDRLVSTVDYAFFARTFAGIGKAAAWRDRHRQLVQVVVAGADDIPIEPTSDLYHNLFAALHRFGDPFLPIKLDVRERLALVISANVKIDADYQWETMEPKIRAALLDRFSFEQTDLGQHIFLSDAIDVIQSMRGVIYVDVDVFAPIGEQQLREGFSGTVSLGRLDRIGTQAKQIAYLVPEVPDTLILQELKS